jgi:glucokinase
MYILAGDIGGTNSRLVFAEAADDGRYVVAEKSYSSADYAGLMDVIDLFLSEHKITEAIDAACFAIAGPVESGVAKVTNLPWLIKEQELSKRLHTVQVRLINDLAAAAYGIAELQEADLLLLQQGLRNDESSSHPDAVVVAAGTGLGAAHRVWLSDHYRVLPTESGHAGFAPDNSEQTELLAWLQKSNAHVSLEMLLSGRGFLTIYQFLGNVKGYVESSAVNDAMRNNDPARVIAEHGLTGDDALCRKTLDVFIDIYGAAAGDIVLQHYPVKELYIAGGIAPKIKDGMLGSRFIDAFINKNLMSANMKKVTVKLILQERAGLIGALSVAQSSMVSQ